MLDLSFKINHHISRIFHLFNVEIEISQTLEKGCVITLQQFHWATYSSYHIKINIFHRQFRTIGSGTLVYYFE